MIATCLTPCRRYISKGICQLGFMLLLILVINPTRSSAQLHIDFPLQREYHSFGEPLKLIPNKAMVLPRFGVTVLNAPKRLFKLSLEFGAFNRRFNQEFGQNKYHYRFPGVQLNLLASYQLFQNFFIEAGGGAALYGSNLRGPEGELKSGRGFQGSDLGLIGGIGYYFGENIAVGSRYTKFFRPMLGYQLIGAYGNFYPKEKDILAQRLELYIRIQFANNLAQ